MKTPQNTLGWFRKVAVGRRLLSGLGLAMILWMLVGCGPVQSTQRISEAEVALERARVADAAVYAPYEYYSAYHYLYKAKEEWGYSDFQASYDYATQARRAAEAALDKAREDPWAGHPVEGAEEKISAESKR